jgi:hypothetical protein
MATPLVFLANGLFLGRKGMAIGWLGVLFLLVKWVAFVNAAKKSAARCASQSSVGKPRSTSATPPVA